MKSQRVWIASALLCAAIGVAGIGFMLSSIGKGHQLLHAAMDGDPAQILRELQRHPDDPVLWSYLGGAYAGTRRYDDAQRAYRRALALDPTKAEVWWMLGITQVCRQDAAGVGEVQAKLDALDHESGREYRSLAPKGCCAFGGCPASDLVAPDNNAYLDSSGQVNR